MTCDLYIIYIRFKKERECTYLFVIEVNISEIRDSGSLYSSSRLNIFPSRPSGGLRCIVSLCLLPLSLILSQSICHNGIGSQHSTLFQSLVHIL